MAREFLFFYIAAAIFSSIAYVAIQLATGETCASDCVFGSDDGAVLFVCDVESRIHNQRLFLHSGTDYLATGDLRIVRSVPVDLA